MHKDNFQKDRQSPTAKLSNCQQPPKTNCQIPKFQIPKRLGGWEFEELGVESWPFGVCVVGIWKLA
jgi:hypothetical protein